MKEVHEEILTQKRLESYLSVTPTLKESKTIFQME